MKRMYLLTVLIIAVLTVGFLILLKDENQINKKFLSGFGIVIEEKPYIVEEIVIPEEFDDYFESYNILQMESGLSLSKYKGKKGVKYTYKMLNFPQDTSSVFVNVITINSKPVAGDINSPTLSGFLLPLSYMSSQ